MILARLRSAPFASNIRVKYLCNCKAVSQHKERKDMKYTECLLAMILALTLVCSPIMADSAASHAVTGNIDPNVFAGARVPTTTLGAALQSALSIYLKDYANFLQKNGAPGSGGAHYEVHYDIASNRGLPDDPKNDDSQVTYIHGSLKYNKASNTFYGDGYQYFSDRRGFCPACSSDMLSTKVYSFDETHADKVYLEINAESSQAKLTLLSQGNAVQTINLRYENNLLYGFTDTNPSIMYVISLNKYQWSDPH